ncbi:hypothetical protein ACFQ6U_36985 [Streptomyces sp. NPDC056465]|uniref:hypothetical protein n=1 Tax=Streptomyces sp. NPDC056465 TaxID=3345829 RepID=UPI00367E3ACD
MTDQEMYETVFKMAANQTSWKFTNLGATTCFSHNGYSWTVVAPSGQTAYILGRSNMGGTELGGPDATWSETLPITEAVMAHRRC